MLWWVSVAPLGAPVVPLVYWMLIGSSQSSAAMRARSSRFGRPRLAGGQRVPLGRVEEDDVLERGSPSRTSSTIAR